MKVQQTLTVLFLSCLIFIVLLIQHTQYLSFNQRLTNVRNSYTKELTSDEVLQRISEELPLLPINDIVAKSRRKLNSTCAPYPELTDIQFHNLYWQTFRNKDVTFQIYGAYYDKRAAVKNGPLVRILAMVSKVEGPFEPTFCQLWYSSIKEPIIVPVVDFKLIWVKQWGTKLKALYPFLVSCKVRDDVKDLIPETVSLVDEECDRATNIVKVVFDEPVLPRVKDGFAVCVKSMDFPVKDNSVRLIEWLELIRILGAAKVIMYVMQIQPNVENVLKYYESTGYVEVRRITMAQGIPGLSMISHYYLKSTQLNKRLNELITYNDCLYRNMYKYDYIVSMDIDEVIMPLGEMRSWNDIMNSTEQEIAKTNNHNDLPYCSHCFNHFYYPPYDAMQDEMNPEIPEYFYLLNHIRQDTNIVPEGHNLKCFHNTNYVLSLHNHFPLSWMDSQRPRTVNGTIGQLNHYRDEMFQNVSDYIKDYSIHRFKEPLIDQVQRVLKELDMLGGMNSN